MNGQLNASKVFSSMTVFDMLGQQLHMMSMLMMRSITGKVSLDRVNEFLGKASRITSTLSLTLETNKVV